MNRSARRRLGGLGAVTAAVGVAAALLAQGAAGAAPAAAGVSAAAQAPASVPAWAPVRKTLYFGDRGADVRRVQERLNQLHYYPGAIDGQFGPDTLEAVWAFKEAQGLSTGATANEIGYYMERALVHPRLPKVLRPRGGANRIEVSQPLQLLVLYRHNKPYLISHVSTGAGCLAGQGCGWLTPPGSYRSVGFLPGWVQVPLGEMYNPVFFIGRTYAIHGEWDSSVPLYPDSHGCVRMPYVIATFFHDLVPANGERIYIVGLAPGT